MEGQGITGTWRNPHTHRRCERKSQYPNLTKASRYAEKASLKSGELIIAYECMDCGYYHIGHADRAELIARGMSNHLLNFAKKETC